MWETIMLILIILATIAAVLSGFFERRGKHLYDWWAHAFLIFAYCVFTAVHILKGSAWLILDVLILIFFFISIKKVEKRMQEVEE